ncbi:molybdopterin-dependent oxidoreductase [Curtobacterium sp. Leaf261]|uniref:molybdopterin-dependent oxidoreductase n=1 Tax=Curtobacterium sp. Leaf261 TaxID=1736311 RepID=UPI0006F5FBB9|nr:molybdopterin-dependent oxidoreductase [Curtobacterium sp. Leaf261]KQO62754.1 molybdopterin-binding protein [Curtobacterium sp. Leaf261]
MNLVHRLLNDVRRGLASPNRNARSAVVLGRLLGLAFVVCFGTGLYSHFLQEPLPWMHFPTRPTQLYQLTQGLHITAGIAIIPLLLGKLNTVMPALAQDPPVRGLLHLLERASIAVFVSAAIVQVMTGLVNTYQWYPWPFPFKQTHYALSYVLIGSLAIHIGVKLRIIARYWRKRDSYDTDGRFVEDRTVGSELVAPVLADDARAPRGLTGRVMRWMDGAADATQVETQAERADAARASRLADDERASAPDVTGEDWIADAPVSEGVEHLPVSDPAPDPVRVGRRQRLARRGFFAGIGAAVAGVVVLTVGQSNTLGVPFNVFGPRQRGIGPNDLPVNRTAKAAGVLETAMADDWGLTIAGNGIRKRFSRDDLRAMGLVDADLPISCVEGWSQMGSWRGVRMRDVVGLVGAPPASRVRVTSLEQHGGYRIMDMGPEYTSDPTTLIALELNGSDLDIDHGYPARIIAPGRPGVLQTKWLASIEVIS